MQTTTILQHYLNPLHIYCRMRDIRIPKGIAMFLCKLYEKMFRNFGLFVFLGLFLVACGCSSVKGSAISYYDSFAVDPSIHKVIILEKVKIVIVGSEKQWEAGLGKANLKNIGYAFLDKGEVWLYGRRDENGFIVVNAPVLGHEIQELMRFRDIEIRNPNLDWD